MAAGTRAERKAEKKARKDAELLAKVQGYIDKADQAYTDYFERTAVAVQGDREPGEQVLTAQSVTRAGININRTHVVNSAATAVANRVREDEHVKRARDLGFPDARLMVLVCTDRRLLVYERSKLSQVEERWGKPAGFVGALPLDTFTAVQWQQPTFNGTAGSAGVIVFVYANGAQHWVSTWNRAERFGTTFNDAVAG